MLAVGVNERSDVCAVSYVFIMLSCQISIYGCYGGDLYVLSGPVPADAAMISTLAGMGHLRTLRAYIAVRDIDLSVVAVTIASSPCRLRCNIFVP